MYMDDIEPFAENEKELKTQVQVVRVYSKDIGLEFGRERCDMLIMRNMKTTNDGRNRSAKSRKNQNTLREKETYK